MKILFLLHSYYKYNQGGAELQVKYITEYMKNNSFEIYYIFLHDKDIEIIDEELYLYGIKKQYFCEKLLGKLCYYSIVLSKIKKIQPDIIYHRNLSNFSLPIVQYCKNNNCASILHLAHANDLDNKILFNKKIILNILNQLGKQLLFKKFDRIIAQAKYQDILLQKNFKRKADIILGNIHPYPTEIIQKEQKIKILWIANYKPWKQPELFVKLANECKNMNAEFILIGRDDQDIMLNFAKNNNVTYHGELSIDAVNKELATAHIFINTSIAEGFPNTFIQAWMREVPVISLNVDPDNILTIHNIGFHSKTYDQLLKNTKELINNHQLRMKMGKNAKKFSFEKYSLKNIDTIIQLIKDIR